MKTTLNHFEREIAELLIEGLSDSEIADFTGRSVQMVKNQLKEMYDRFGVEDDSAKRVGLALYLHGHRHEFGLHCVSCA